MTLKEAVKLSSKKDLTKEEAKKIIDWYRNYKPYEAEDYVYDESEAHTAYECWLKASDKYPELWSGWIEPINNGRKPDRDFLRFDALTNENDLGRSYLQSMQKARR